jgi:ABC-2 type transport system permease protein
MTSVPTPITRGLSALVRKSIRASANFGRVAREQSVLKTCVIAAVALLLAGGLGKIFYEGFQFIATLGGAGLMIVQNLFALFFLGLGLMLIFSSAVTAYSAIFRADEMNFLVVRPLPIGHVIIHKFWEVAALSSWAFFFMVIPFVAAYAFFQRLSPMFAVWTILFAGPFVMICAAFGTIISMLVVRFIPHGRQFWLTVGTAAFIALGMFIYGTFQGVRSGDEAQLVLTRLIPGMKLSSYPLWPSYWMAEGILSFARDNASRGALLWLLLASTAGVCTLVVEGVGRLTFYESWHRRAPASTRSRAATSITGLERFLGFLRHDTRAVLIKDIRIFLRDPMQWSQALIFFGLLGIYFFNLRNFSYNLRDETWRNIIAWLNLISVSAVTCSLSARFTFPQMSLEGHAFWLLGLSPMSMRRVLRAKFGLAFAALGIVGVTLTAVSAHMLAIRIELRIIAIFVALCVAAAMAGLSCGLGALFLDLRNRNPVAIISGFGGTLNLVLGLAFIFAAVLPFAIVSHSFHEMGGMSRTAYHIWLLTISACLSALTALAVWVPLHLGGRSLEQREY